MGGRVACEPASRLRARLKQRMQAGGARDLRFFLDLARRKTAQSRLTLFENVADLFIREAGRLSERERSQIPGILHDLLADVATLVRLGLVYRRHETPAVPASMVQRLDNDALSIPPPFLLLTRVPT